MPVHRSRKPHKLTKREKKRAKRMRRQRWKSTTPQRATKRKKKKKWCPKSLADILFHNRDELIGTVENVLIDATHQYFVAKFVFGYVFECESIDEKDLLEREMLFSRDGKVWTLLGRYRKGPFHHDDKWYPRDTTYPIGCKIRL